MSDGNTPAVVERQEIAKIDQRDDSGVAFIDMIERLSRSPDVRMDVLQGLVAMRNDELQRVAKQEYIVAMAKAQSEMEPVRREATNSQTKSKYATYDALDRAIRPIYTQLGFSVRYDTADAPRDLEVRVVAKIAHSSGYEELSHIDIPADGKGAKGGEVMTRTHAVISAVSYGKRALLGMGFNIATTDDDGNAAGGNTQTLVSKEQVTAMQAAIMEGDLNIADFFKYAKIDRLEDMEASRYEWAMREIATAAANKTRKARRSDHQHDH